MWYVYLAKCNDNTIYTGITIDILRREHEHNFDNKLGAKSLRSKRPIEIVYVEQYSTQSEARIREAEVKGWKRLYKIKLIEENRGIIPKNSGFTQKIRRIVLGR